MDPIILKTLHLAGVIALFTSLGATLLQQGHEGICVSALCPGFVDTPLVPADVQPFIAATGMPIVPPSRVADAAMEALAAHVHGSQWIVWGDVIRQNPPVDLGLM